MIRLFYVRFEVREFRLELLDLGFKCSEESMFLLRNQLQHEFPQLAHLSIADVYQGVFHLLQIRCYCVQVTSA